MKHAFLSYVLPNHEQLVVGNGAACGQMVLTQLWTCISIKNDYALLKNNYMEGSGSATIK